MPNTIVSSDGLNNRWGDEQARGNCIELGGGCRKSFFSGAKQKKRIPSSHMSNKIAYIKPDFHSVYLHMSIFLAEGGEFNGYLFSFSGVCAFCGDKVVAKSCKNECNITHDMKWLRE